MPSPELADLHDLTLYDRGPDELRELALELVETKFPEWQYVAGDTGVVLIEAFALVCAEIGYSLNRIVGAVMDVLFRLYLIERSVGAQPIATVTFHTSTGNPLVIPAGTVVRLEPVGADPVNFTVDEASAGPGPDVVAAVTGDEYSAAVNGAAIGTALVVVTSLPDVDTAVLATAVADGADPEDETAWRARAVQRLQRLTTTLVVPKQFTAAAREHVGVAKATTFDNNNNGTVAAGHVTVAVLGPAGALLSSGAKADLAAELEQDAQVNLAVHVIDPTITAVAVTVTVKALEGFDPADVEANVLADLDAYLSPATWQWSATVRKTDLIQVIENAAGVDYITTGGFTAPAGDVALSGVAPLADLDSAGTTITVT